jgi:uncharacterized protein (DUF433 family)
MPQGAGDQPSGHYFAAEVGQLSGVSGKRVGQWARRGYIRSSQDEDTPRIYSFEDVAEAIVVHELENRDVRPVDVGRIVSALRERLGTEWPLQVVDLMIPERHPRAKRAPQTFALRTRQGIEELYTSHPVLGELDLISVARDLSRGGWAAREMPDLEHIEVNPARLSGRPTIRGRRVAAREVANLSVIEGGLETLTEGMDLTQQEIRDAVRWWNRVQEYEAAA